MSFSRATLAGGLLAGAAGLLGAWVVGLFVGSSWLSPAEVWAGLFGVAGTVEAEIVRAARLPSIWLAWYAGTLLGGAGAVTQGVFRNPLADPYILGVSGGAALGAALGIAMGGGAPGGVATPALGAFAGAGVALLALVTFAGWLPGGFSSSQTTPTLLLAGVVLNALASAAILVLFAVASPFRTQEILFWLVGSISPGRASALQIGVAASAGIGALSLCIGDAHRLNALVLGDVEAAALGIEPGKVRRRLLIASSLMVACAVGYTGLIGFVGLVVPHLARLGFGADHRLLIPLSALAGGAFLVLADAASRGVYPLTGGTLPVGAVTAVLGAPLFLALLVSQVRRDAGESG